MAVELGHHPLPGATAMSILLSNGTDNASTTGETMHDGGGERGSWQKVVVPVVFTLVVLLGFIGNALVIAVVLKNRVRSTTNLFILNLAIADLLFLVFCVPFHAVIYSNDTWPFGEVLCKFVHFVQYSSMVASIFTLVAMSADRYCAVAYALQTKHFRTPLVAFIVSACIWLASLIVAGPMPVIYTVKSYHGLQICSYDWSSLPGGQRIYVLFLFIIAYVFPLVTIFILSTLMVRQLWVLKEPEGPSMRASVLAKRKVTRLIIVVVFVFSLCWLPSHIVWIWASFFKHTVGRASFGLVYLKIVAHVLAYANSAMNPVIYAFLSVNFRKGFQHALPCSDAPARRSGGGVVTQRIVFSKPSYSLSAN